MLDLLNCRWHLGAGANDGHHGGPRIGVIDGAGNHRIGENVAGAVENIITPSRLSEREIHGTQRLSKTLHFRFLQRKTTLRRNAGAVGRTRQGSFKPSYI
jgi:hypothetical protein